MLEIITTIIFIILFLTPIIFLMRLQGAAKNQRHETWQQFSEARNLDFEMIHGQPELSWLHRKFSVHLSRLDNDQIVHLRLRLSLSQLDIDERRNVLPQNEEVVKLRANLASLQNACGQLSDWDSNYKLHIMQTLIYLDCTEGATSLQKMYDLTGPISVLFEAYWNIAAIGGVAAPYLIANVTDQSIGAATSSLLVHQITASLLKEIREDTRHHLADRDDNVYCARCLTHIVPHYADQLSLKNKLTHYGCRLCHNSSDVLQGKTMKVVLDNGSEVMLIEEDRIIINWLVNRRIFDFERVEIIQATDEEVERFAVQVGNDTDAFRRERYQTMLCFVETGCDLSPNTIRILKQTFGEVLVR